MFRLIIREFFVFHVEFPLDRASQMFPRVPNAFPTDLQLLINAV